MSEETTALTEALEHGVEIWKEIEGHDLAQMIPGVNHVVKLYQGIKGIREHIFAAKLKAFICEPHLQSREAREQWQQRIKEDSKEARHVGETLVLTLEKLSDLQKPIWIAKVFAAYLAKELTAGDLRRMASGIETAFGDDLVEFLAANLGDSDHARWRRALVAAGFTEVRSGGPGGGRLRFEISEAGEQLRKVVQKYA